MYTLSFMLPITTIKLASYDIYVIQYTLIITDSSVPVEVLCYYQNVISSLQKQLIEYKAILKFGNRKIY